MGRLDGKVALIVGGGADGPPNAGETLSIGNGRATAILCAREGAAVMVADRAETLAGETAAAIRAEGGRAGSVAADVTLEDDCRRACEAAVRAFGKLDLLVNNVGIAIGGRLLETTIEQFDTMSNAERFSTYREKEFSEFTRIRRASVSTVVSLIGHRMSFGRTLKKSQIFAHHCLATFRSRECRPPFTSALDRRPAPSIN